jgi:hypothetical protein
MSASIETPEMHRHNVARDRAALLVGIAALIFALAIVVYVVWLIFASVKATPFDADGVRCYTKAIETVCLKTAEPPR